MEAARTEGRHAREEFLARRGRKHAEHRRVGEGRVGEVGGPQIGPEPDQLVRDEGQVVVLHEDAGTFGRDLGQAKREQLVELAVGIPRLAPSPVDPRPTRCVEEMVVAEPERAVRHQVVGHRKELGIGVDQLDPDSLVDHHPEARRSTVGFTERRRNPGCARAGDERPKRTGEPSARGGRLRTPFDQVERERPAVGHEHGVGERPVPLGTDPVGGHAIDATRLAAPISNLGRSLDL